VVAESVLVKHQLLILKSFLERCTQISASVLAWSPACVRFSCAPAG
jgi:hypothetical protein